MSSGKLSPRRSLWDCRDEPDDNALDRQFILNRDSTSRQDVRDFVDNLWSRYGRYCGDHAFSRRLKREFNSLTWQMYTGVCLLEAGLVLERPAPNEPDHKVRLPASTLWVECIATGPGEGDNEAKRIFGRAPREDGYHSGPYRPPPDDVIALRITRVLWEKTKQHRKRLKSGVVAPDHPYVVAVGAGNIPDADLELELPHIVKILYGLEEPVIRYELYSDKEAELVPVYRDEIVRDRGENVSRRGFLDDHLAEVSAVIFSAHGVWNPPRAPGRDLITVHNACASNPLDPGWLPLGREYWATSHLQQVDHRRPLP